VLAWHTDRLYRSFRDLEPFVGAVEAAQIPVATVQAGTMDLASPTGRMIARILGSVAAQEVEHKSVRQKRKAEELARAGKPNGGGMRPYGYERGGMIVRSDEAVVIREAASRILAGESTYEVARDLAERNIPTSTGAEWTYRLLRRTLRLPRLAGLRTHEGELYQGTWPAILDRGTWDALQERLAVRRPRGAGGRGRREYLLTGFLRCGRCGGSLRGHPNHGKRSYACLSESGGCGKIRIVAEPTEAVIAEALFSAIDGGAVGKALAAAAEDAAGAEVMSSIEADRASLDELSRDYYARKAITRSEYEAARELLATRIARAEQALSRREETAVLVGMSSSDVAREAWEGWETSDRRELLAALIERIDVAPSTVYRFDPERLSIVWRA
jgi:hypothetical protein